MSVQTPDPDRLYRLLPALYRIADERQDAALRTLLALITEQADALRADGFRLLDDFFVETCRPWALPYLGDLLGTVPLHDLSPADAAATAESLLLGVVTGPDLRPPSGLGRRADLARTIHYRRRKGTPLGLEELARAVTGWGARVVEFFTLLGWNQHLEHLRPAAAGCADLHTGGQRFDGPWDTAPHTVDVRSIERDQGRYNLPNLGFFLWRVGAYRITGGTPRQAGAAWQLTFSPLGLDMPLFSAGRAIPPDSGHAGEADVEAPLRLAEPGDNLTLHTANGPAGFIPCDLRTWPANQPTGTSYGVDVRVGRLVVPAGLDPVVRVDYHYGFSAAMGGGSYPRGRWIVPGAAVTVSGGGTALQTVLAQAGGPPPVITIADSATYPITDPLTLSAGQRLTIQATDGVRPHVRLPATGWTLTAAADTELTLGGLLVEGALDVQGQLGALRLMHTTLVPAAGPSVSGAIARTQLAFAITGGLRLARQPARLWILDSIVDAGTGAAIGGPAGFGPSTHVERSTVFGTSQVAALPMAGESIFTGLVTAQRRGDGCVRFSYLPEGSQTPRQYRCRQSPAPVFTASRYGQPGYAQLHRSCPEELTTGAEDGSEMGAFCLLRQPHRVANLRLRLGEYLPIGRAAGLIYVT